MKSLIYQPPIRGFMDDPTVTTTTQLIYSVTHTQARYVLSLLEDSVPLARMKFKPKKYRCPVLRKGRVNRPAKMQVQGEEIQLNAWEDTNKRFQTWLKIVDGSG